MMPGPETSSSEEQPLKEEGSQESQRFDLEAYGREREEKLTELTHRRLKGGGVPRAAA